MPIEARFRGVEGRVVDCGRGELLVELGSAFRGEPVLAAALLACASRRSDIVARPSPKDRLKAEWLLTKHVKTIRTKKGEHVFNTCWLNNGNGKIWTRLHCWIRCY